MKVTVTSHETLNCTQGTVMLPDNDEKELPSKQILTDSLKLRYNNIHDLELYAVPSRRDTNKHIKIVKIKFTNQELPRKIKILALNREVRPFVPKPLQCSKCLKYGHSTKRCRNNAICAVCSEDQPSNV